MKREMYRLSKEHLLEQKVKFCVIRKLISITENKLQTLNKEYVDYLTKHKNFKIQLEIFEENGK